MLPAVASMSVPPGFSLPVAFGRFDEVEADAVLDRAAGVLVLELQEQLAADRCRDGARPGAACGRSVSSGFWKTCGCMEHHGEV